MQPNKVKNYPRIWAALLILAFLLVIVVLADRGTLPGWVTSIYTFSFGDKIGHFFLMGLLALALNMLSVRLKGRTTWRGLRIGTWVALFFVTVEELSQIAFTARSFSLVDLSFSFLGILAVDRLLHYLAK